MKQSVAAKTLIALALTCLIVEGNVEAAIIYPKAPEGGHQLVSEYVGDLVQTQPDAFGGMRREELTFGTPCQNFSIDLTNLTAGRFLSDVRRTEYWTYPVLHGTNIVGSAGLLADEKTGKALKCTELSGSDWTQEALKKADQLPKVKKYDYELRLLHEPAILFMAIWLHGDSDDIIIPLGDSFGRWKSYHPYSEKQMLKLLQPVAEKKLKEPPGF